MLAAYRNAHLTLGISNVLSKLTQLTLKLHWSFTKWSCHFQIKASLITTSLFKLFYFVVLPDCTD